MSNRAWMPLHIDDYIRDTDHLSATEHGAYLLLIMKYWRDGGLPSDEGLIRRYAKLTPEQWAESRDVLAMLFGDGWRHKRIDAEIAKASDIIEKRRTAGRRTQFTGKRSAKAEQMPEQKPSKCTVPLTNNLSDASASDAVPASRDVRDVLWSDGLSTLSRISGKTQGASRSMIGKWLRDSADDCALVLAKIRQAEAERIGDPVAWISRAVKPRDPPMTVGDIFREDAKRMGIIDDEPSQAGPRRVETRFRPGQGGGSDDAVRFALPANVLGRIG